MAALRRGATRHYAEGDSDVPAVVAAPVPVPVAPAAPSGIGQLLTGQFKSAQQNPESSPATAALGSLADYISRSNRVDAISKGPSMKDRLVNLFGGNQASTAAITQHDAASTALRDPLVQQHLMNNPDEIALAEKNRLGYAQQVQTPAFRKVIETAVAANTAAGANPKVTTDEHPKVVTAAVNHGVTADQAHAALAPRKYTEDEFVNTFKGIPTATFALLFGQQLGHVRTPQEKVATEIFDRLHGGLAEADTKVKALEAQDAELIKQGKNPVHSQSSWFGKSALDIAKAERDARQKVLMDAAASFTGISAKPYPVPGQP